MSFKKLFLSSRTIYNLQTFVITSFTRVVASFSTKQCYTRLTMYRNTGSKVAHPFCLIHDLSSSLSLNKLVKEIEWKVFNYSLYFSCKIHEEIIILVTWSWIYIMERIVGLHCRRISKIYLFTSFYPSIVLPPPLTAHRVWVY